MCTFRFSFSRGSMIRVAEKRDERFLPTGDVGGDIGGFAVPLELRPGGAVEDEDGEDGQSE